jgi:hypothetical protein
MRNFLMSTAVLAMGLTAAGSAQAALKDEAEIRNGLLVVGMAYEISEKCGSIDARTLRGITTLLNDLQNAGLQMKDLQTQQSSLEDIFVGLVKETA